MSIQQQVSRAIRILRGNRDVSARASHLVVQQDQLMTYESVLVGQAEMEKFSKSTFSERKIMSTKTSIKRIAAVAAVALTLGGFSAVSAHAAAVNGGVYATADSTGTLTATDAATATGVAGANNYVTVKVVELGSPVVLVASSGVINAGASSLASTTTGTGTASIVVPAGTAGTADTGIQIPTPVVGTITVSSYAITNGVQASTATSTVTITVGSSLPGAVFNHASAFIGATGAEATVDAAASALSAGSTASSTAVARIDVRQYSTADTTTAMTTNTTTTVSVSGAGAVDTASNGATRGPSASIAAVTNTGGLQTFYVFPDGRTGTSTITVTVNGVVTATKTYTFVGSAAKYVFDNVAADLVQAATYKTYIGVGDTGTLTITAADVNGNTAAVGTIAAATSSNTAVATVAITTNSSSATTAVLTVTGVATGTANITIVDSTSAAVKTLVIPVRVTGTTVAKVTLTFDSSSYAPGQKGTLTAAAFTSAGDPVADGTRDIWGTVPTFSTIVQGTAPTFVVAGEALAAGVVTYTFYAPVTNGTLTVSGTDSTSAANTVSATASVSSTTDAAAQAAVDAANEATDAANAATDAANNAMDSADAAQQAALDAGDKADAALAAVTDLASKVADIATQISALSSLVSKIAASVAKISAKVKA